MKTTFKILELKEEFIQTDSGEEYKTILEDWGCEFKSEEDAVIYIDDLKELTNKTMEVIIQKVFTL